MTDIGIVCGGVVRVLNGMGELVRGKPATPTVFADMLSAEWVE